MTTKTITIAGKEITLAYCWDTEIKYKLLSDEDIIVYLSECIEALERDTIPDKQKTIHAIIAAVNAYSEWKGEQPPVTDRELRFETTPLELGTAWGTFLKLRAEFYKLPAGEPKDEQPENTESKKNA